jgi:5,5'-dehydrodivanillate O-demethylase
LRIPVGLNETQHWRTPVNDTSTRIFVAWFTPNETGEDEAQPSTIPVEVLKDDVLPNGDYALNNFDSQDRMAWETQGAIVDRTAEHLGVSDTGVVMLRKLLDEQISVVEAGGEPMGVLRDPEKNAIITFTSHTVNRLTALT